jgi:hypothetical protein
VPAHLGIFVCFVVLRTAAAAPLVSVRILDQRRHLAGVDLPRRRPMLTTQRRLRIQTVRLIQRPDLLAVSPAPLPRCKAREEAMEILDVPQQEFFGIPILSRVDRLGKVDHDGTVGSHQDVEIRQISVDHPRT